MKKFKDSDMQLLLGQVLRLGTVISICIVFFGGILYLHGHGHSTTDYKRFKSVPISMQHAPGIFKRAFSFDAVAIIELGIVLLIATPIMRVIFSAMGFLLEKDYLYVGISLLVLFIIFMSMLHGAGG